MLASQSVAGGAGAQVRSWPSEGAPRPLPARAVQFPPYEVRTLENGLQVVAVLHLLKDVTSNASLLTLLTGPRWAIGPRDLKLLGDRARELAGARGRGEAPASIDDHLVAIAPEVITGRRVVADPAI